MATARACHRAHLHQVVARGKHMGVVVDHDDGVAVGHEVAHHAKEAFDICRVQADRRLVEHIEDAGRAVAHGTGQLHALPLAGRERGAGAVEREIPQAKLHKAARHIEERLADVARHGLHRLGQLLRHIAHPHDSIVERKRTCLGQRQAAHARSPRTLGQSCARAVAACSLMQEFCHACQAFFVLGLGQGVLHRVHGVVIGEVELGEIVARLGVIQDMLLHGRTVEDDVTLRSRELVERHVGAHAHRACDLLHEVPHKAAPGLDRALVDGERLVGHQARKVHLAHHARATAGGAGAAGVEREVLGVGCVKVVAARGAGDGLAGRHIERRRAAGPAMRAYVPGAAREQKSQAVEQLGHRAEGRAHTRHGRTLVQRKRRGHMQHLVNAGTTRLREATACVGGERLEVAPAAFRVEHAERQRALARARHAGHAYKLAQRNVDVDVFEVVHPGPAHLDARGGFDVSRHSDRSILS